MTLEPQIDPTDRRVKKQHKGINRGNTRAYSVARTGTATSRESPQRDQTSTGNRVRDEEVALALWRAGRGGGWPASDAVARPVDINADHNPMPPRWTSANDTGPLTSTRAPHG